MNFQGLLFARPEIHFASSKLKEAAISVATERIPASFDKVCEKKINSSVSVFLGLKSWWHELFDLKSRILAWAAGGATQPCPVVFVAVDGIESSDFTKIGLAIRKFRRRRNILSIALFDRVQSTDELSKILECFDAAIDTNEGLSKSVVQSIVNSHNEGFHGYQTVRQWVVWTRFFDLAVIGVLIPVLAGFSSALGQQAYTQWSNEKTWLPQLASIEYLLLVGIVIAGLSFILRRRK